MAAIQFYHLTATPLERALPKLMEKAHSAGLRTLLVAGARADELDEVLWTYDQGSFLPHGTAANGHADMQPILIVPAMESPAENRATLLAITDGTLASQPENFDRILDIFDGSNPQEVAAARTRWTEYKAAGHALTYLRQNDLGGWQQPAAA